MSNMRIPVLLFLVMILVVLVTAIVWAGLQSNLWAELSATAELPWGLVTITDLSAGLLIVALWIAAMERRWWPTVGWVVLLACLGNVITVVYLMIRIWRSDSVIDAITPGGAGGRVPKA